METALNSIIVTTDNPEEALKYYTKGLKLKLVAESSPDPEAFQLVWGLAEKHPIKEWVLKRRASDEHGYLRLLHIRGAGGRDIRQGARRWDHGIFDLAFVVRDNEQKTASIRGMGYNVYTNPLRYDVGKNVGYYVTQSMVGGPNQVVVAFMERFNAPHVFGHLEMDTGFSELVDSAQVVQDIDDSVKFYNELLGVDLRGLFRGVRGTQNDIIGIPPSKHFNMSLLGSNEVAASNVELLSFPGLEGHRLEAQSSILNYGLAALSFAVADLAGAYSRLKENGVTVRNAPVRTQIGAVGLREAFTCLAPSGIPCEIYARA